jgi:hypothetical protein
MSDSASEARRAALAMLRHLLGGLLGLGVGTILSTRLPFGLSDLGSPLVPYVAVSLCTLAGLAWPEMWPKAVLEVGARFALLTVLLWAFLLGERETRAITKGLGGLLVTLVDFGREEG